MKNLSEVIDILSAFHIRYINAKKVRI